MHFKRPFLRLTVVCTGALLLLGCDSKTKQHQPATSSAETRGPAAVDHLAVARRMLLIRDYDAAAQAAYKTLVQDPENNAATLVASEAEAARGNHQIAADLARSIDIESRHGVRAVELHHQQLVELNQLSAAADVILAAQKVIADVPEWRHRAWELLNRVGRREEASLQADALCRGGQATEQELHSLIRRTRSFPFNLKDGQDPGKYFAPGLGMARWYFTQEEYGQALKELSTQYENGFESAAACALYGRLLAETQAFEEFPAWHAKCDEQTRALGDYWAALGTYFYDQHRFEGSARALLESVYHNPTDRLSLQRLSKVLSSLDRSQDGQLYRERGIKVVETEKLSDALLEANERSFRMSLVKKLADLGRPFETLQWTASMARPSSPERIKIDDQRAELQRSSRVWKMAAESSLLGIARQDFSIEAAMELLRSPDKTNAPPNKISVDVLARPRLVNVASQVGIEFQWYQDVEMNLAMIPDS